MRRTRPAGPAGSLRRPTLPPEQARAMASRAEVTPLPPPPLAGVESDIRVAFILCPRFTLMAFAAFVESLRHAADEADYSRQIYCTWKIVAEDMAQPIDASCGARLLPHEPLGDFGRLNYIVVVGGLLPHALNVGSRTRDYILAAHRRGISVVGLCTGSFVLAELGLLDGRRCAVHHEHVGAFRTAFPDTHPEADAPYINDNEVLTCPGGAAALDLAFHLIDAHCGKSRALKGLSSLLVSRSDIRRSLVHVPHGHLACCGDPAVEAAIAAMQQAVSAPLPIRALASRIGCSERELCRRFHKHGQVSPSDAYRDIRLAHGRRLLLGSSKSLVQIADECGFADAAHFIRCFKAAYAEAPGAYRRRRKFHTGATPSGKEAALRQ